MARRGYEGVRRPYVSCRPVLASVDHVEALSAALLSALGIAATRRCKPSWTLCAVWRTCLVIGPRTYNHVGIPLTVGTGMPARQELCTAIDGHLLPMTAWTVQTPWT